MKQLITLLAVLAFAAAAFAEGLPSSKATADINTLVKCTMKTDTSDDGDAIIPESCVELYTGATVATDNEWIPIMSKKVKLSNSQSLFVSPSLVSGLYTRTRTKTATNSTSTAQAMGGVYLRAVLVKDSTGDVIEAAPLSRCSSGILGCVNPGDSGWGVMLDTRIQTLTQSLSECTVLVGDLTGTCSFTSVIDLVLNTTSAHTFNLIFPSVGQGTYTLKVMAAVASGASIIEGSGTAVGAAAFGLGSVMAESVRLVHDFEF